MTAVTKKYDVVNAMLSRFAWGHSRISPGDLVSPPNTAWVQITSRNADKFAHGWLGGVGNGSQFQSTYSALPIIPMPYNDTTRTITRQSQGVSTGQRLLTRYERPFNFNPGLGTDTWRPEGNVVWTMAGRGAIAQIPSGVAGPLVYPGLNETIRHPLPQQYDRGQGLSAMTSAPVHLVDGYDNIPIAMNMFERHQASVQARTAALRRRAGIMQRARLPPPVRGGGKPHRRV